MNKCYSTYGEVFYDRTMDEAVQDAADYPGAKPGDDLTLFEGEAEPINPFSLVTRYHAEGFLDDMQQELYDEVGEIADGWPDTNNAEADAWHRKLQAAFASWLREHGRIPKFFKVTNVREVPVILTEVVADRVEWVEAAKRQEVDNG